MKKEVFINMENQVFYGNVLDIGFENLGIAYNLFRKYNDECAIDYFSGKEERNCIEENLYDSAVMLFSFHSLALKQNKMKMIKDIQRYLKEDGILYIWDIDKGYMKHFHSKIKILLPDRKIKEFVIRDYNIFLNHSKKSMEKLINPYFEIIDIKASDQVYFIKAKKKGNS